MVCSFLSTLEKVNGFFPKAIFINLLIIESLQNKFCKLLDEGFQFVLDIKVNVVTQFLEE